MVIEILKKQNAGTIQYTLKDYSNLLITLKKHCIVPAKSIIVEADVADDYLVSLGHNIENIIPIALIGATTERLEEILKNNIVIKYV